MAGGNSYNGWPASDSPSAIGIDTQFGKKVGAPAFGSGGYAGGMKSGDVSTLFIYLINRLHNEVEPMMNQGGNGYGCWGYSYRANVNNPSQLSCHASGTAIDYNAPKHPNGTSTGPNGGGGWSGSQYNKIQSILAGPLQNSIRWLTSNDPMHFEIYGNSAKIASVAASLGGSTPPPTGDWFDMATKADLEAAVWSQINRPEYLQAVAITVWTQNVIDQPANQMMAKIVSTVEATNAQLPHGVWDNHFEATPDGLTASVGDILAAIYRGQFPQ